MLGAVWHDDKLMNIIAGFFFLLAVVFTGYGAVQWFIRQPVFSLKQFELMETSQRLSVAGFQAQVLPKIRGNFFTVDLNQVRRLVENQPWVRKAVVQRRWPDGLRVSIEEHKPLAQWGNERLVNTFGEVFVANLEEALLGHESNTEILPKLNGPNGSELLVAKMYIDAIERFQPLHLQPIKVELSDRHAWSIKAQHLTQNAHASAHEISIELGRDQEHLSVSAKLDRFVRVYPKIVAEVMPDVRRIDMRYPRGLAIAGPKTSTPFSHLGAGSSVL